MLRALISCAVAIPLAVLGLPWCWQVLVHQWSTRIAGSSDPWPDHAQAVVIGTVLGVALAWWKRPNWFVHTAIHELCHLLACLLLLVRPRKFTVSDGSGGAVEYDAPSDPFRGVIIAIAPYTLPLVLVLALLARRFVPVAGPWEAIASGVAAFAFIHHLQGLYHNIRLNFWGKDSDLVKTGRPLSAVLIAGVLLLVTAWTIHELWPVPQTFLGR